MREGAVMPRVQLALGKRTDTRAFRNHVGLGWTGQLVREDGDVVMLRNARRARFGLCPGSSDLIGLHAVTVTEAMLGRTVAVFLAVETKGTDTAVDPEQEKFVAMVQRFGGIGGIVRSEAEALALLEGFGRG